MKGKKLVLKARQDLDRLINRQPSIEDEPDKDLKASFILSTLHTDSYDAQIKPKARSDPAARGGGRFTTDRKDALHALKIALNEVEEEDAMQEESPPKLPRPVRRRLPVYQENVPQPQEPRQPRVVVHRPPAAPQQPLPVPRVNAVPAPPAAPSAIHGTFQPFDIASLITSIAMHHMQQPQVPVNYPPPLAGTPPPTWPPPGPPVPGFMAPPHPAEVAAMAADLQRHISQFMQHYTGYPFGMAPLAAPGLPTLAALAPIPPANAAAMAVELQQHIARFMQTQSRYMYPIRAPDMIFPFLAQFDQYWMPRCAEGEAETFLGGEGKSSATSANMTSKATRDLENKISDTMQDDNKANAMSPARTFGQNIPLNDADAKDAPPQDSNQGRRQSQRKIKKPVRNTDEAFEFSQKRENKENKVMLSKIPNMQIIFNSRSKAQPLPEAKRGLASTSAATTATATAAAAVAPKVKPAPAVAPLPSQQTLQVFPNANSSAPNSLANLPDESLEAQIKRKTITAVNAHYWPEMPGDIQEMIKRVLDFSKAYEPAGASYFTPRIKALRGAAMYAAQLAVIEVRVEWVVEEMNKDGIAYGWKKGKEPAAGSYEFYRGIALKYLRDRLKSRCRVEAGKRDRK